jgi:type II secretory pathway pseudopilin PulG
MRNIYMDSIVDNHRTNIVYNEFMKKSSDKSKRRKKGFTLVQLLTALIIFAILAGTTYVYVLNMPAKARDIRRMQDFSQMSVALDLFYEEYGLYPCGDIADQPVSYLAPSDLGQTDWSDSCPFLDGNEGYTNPSLCPVRPANNPVCYTDSPGTVGVYPTFGLYSSPQKYYPHFNLENYRYTKKHPYVYRVSADRQRYILQTVLEYDKKAMKEDGGLCNKRYEIGNTLDDAILTQTTNWNSKDMPCN